MVESVAIGDRHVAMLGLDHRLVQTGNLRESVPPASKAGETPALPDRLNDDQGRMVQ